MFLDVDVWVFALRLLDRRGEGCGDGNYILVKFADEPGGAVYLTNGKGALIGVEDGLLGTSTVATHVGNLMMGCWM